MTKYDQEIVAEIIYNSFPFIGKVGQFQKPSWVPNGNSLIQDRARFAARAIAAYIESFDETVKCPVCGSYKQPPFQQDKQQWRVFLKEGGYIITDNDILIYNMVHGGCKIEQVTPRTVF